MFYRDVCALTLTFKLDARADGAFTSDVAEEMVFHGMFGTHKENLHLLRWMTGRAFMTRNEWGAKVASRHGGAEVECKPISVLYLLLKRTWHREVEACLSLLESCLVSILSP